MCDEFDILSEQEKKEIENYENYLCTERYSAD